MCGLLFMNSFPDVYPSSLSSYSRSKIKFLSLITRPKIWIPHTTLPRAIFLKIKPLHPVVRGKTSKKNEVDYSNTFWDILLTDTDSDTQEHRNKAVAGFNKPTFPLSKVSIPQPITWSQVFLCLTKCVSLFLLKGRNLFHTKSHWPR